MGRTALHEAILQRKTSMALELIKCHANITLPDNFGYTAIDYAKKGGYTEILDYLTSAEKPDN